MTKKIKLLLDAGCGEAKSCLRFVDQGYRVIGVEKNSETFKKAQVNIEASKNGKFVELYNDDIRKIDFKEKFDAVVFSYILMFMPKKNALRLIKKYYKKLNKGGELLIKILMSDDLMAETYKEKKEVFFPNREELEEIGKKYRGTMEFKKIEEGPHGEYGYPHTHSIGVLKMKK